MTHTVSLSKFSTNSSWFLQGLLCFPPFKLAVRFSLACVLYQLVPGSLLLGFRRGRSLSDWFSGNCMALLEKCVELRVRKMKIEGCDNELWCLGAAVRGIQAGQMREGALSVGSWTELWKAHRPTCVHAHGLVGWGQGLHRL